MGESIKKQEADTMNRFLILAIFIGVLGISGAVANANELAGNWQGGWKSCNTGHRGRLNAQFCRIDANHVQANFRGTFAKVVPFRYRPVLNVVHEEPGLMVLQGTKKLPLAGPFHYNAIITGDSFSATYRSRRDHGVWTMRR